MTTITIKFKNETVKVRCARNDTAINHAVERESRKRNELPCYYNIN